MKQKEGLEFLQFTGANKEEMEEFTGKVVEVSKTGIYKTAKFGDDPELIIEGDYLVKHGKEIITVFNEVINFLFT